MLNRKIKTFINIARVVLLSIVIFIIGSFTYSLYFGIIRMGRYFALFAISVLVATIILGVLESIGMFDLDKDKTDID